jgi:tetratricopeptide (TPR) repeat protein
MGVVYVVYDHVLGAPLAVKTFQDKIFARNPAVADRFRQEALTWVNLDVHQNITEALLYRLIKGKPYLFLEYVSRGDLTNWVGTPRLTEDLPQVLRFAIQFCDGMTYILSKGIRAHRDIKPQNCLITHDLTLKVTDFGLAKVFDEVGYVDTETEQAHSSSIGLSRTGMAAGTYTHMAPEQFDDAKHVDVRADIYSFGVMLYQMIAGQLPFAGKSVKEFSLLHKSQPAPVLDGQPPGLSGIVARCLVKEAAGRFGNFVEVREALAAVYERLTNEPASQPATGAALDVAQLESKGLSLRELGRHEEALKHFERALEIDSSYEVAWNNKGVGLEDIGRLEEALACYIRALEINSRNKNAWSGKGIVLNKLGRPEEALACCDRALEIDPLYANAWFHKGIVLGDLGMTQEALACYNRGLEINPRHEEGWLNVGVEMNKLGKLDAALGCLQRALEINPRYAKAWSNLATTLEMVGQRAEGMACRERALEINPNDAEAWHNKGVALEELGQPLEALACYKRATKITPPYQKAWLNTAVLLVELGRPQEALTYFDQLLEINPRYGLAWYNKGVMLFRSLGQFDEALASLREAQRLGIPQAASTIAYFRLSLDGKGE